MADPMSVLSVGCLSKVFSGQTITDPIVQCVQVKPMASQQSGVERYRVVLNDSINFIQSMLGSQMNHLVSGDKLKKGSMCRLRGYQPNTVKDKPVLVILDIEVLEEYGETEKLGLPVGLEVAKADAQNFQSLPQTTPQQTGQQQNGDSKPAAQQTSQQRALPSRSTLNNSSRGTIHPIEALSPYTNKWTIKARCTSKGEIKHWHNKNGEGKLFSATFLDGSGEIRATGFNDSVDQWYDILQEGSVYYISCPCKVVFAKKQFSNVNNDYELTFERDTMIEKAEDAADVPQVTYNFTTLEGLQSVENNTLVDAVGILKAVNELSEITSKTTSKPIIKRELTIIDKTNYEVRLTIWGATAQNFSAEPDTVIAFKGLKVSDFGGRSLSLQSSGSMTLDPDIDEAHTLKGWWDATPHNEAMRTHADMMGTTTNSGAAAGKNAYKTIAQIKDENLGMSEDADFFSTKATVIYVKKESFAYPACLTERCNKKVVEIDPGQWRCEKCDMTHDKPLYRYILSVNVADHTGMMWFTCFDEVGQMIMGRTADEVQKARDDGDDTTFDEFFRDATCKSLVFRCKAKMDTYGDEQRVRYQVSSANTINFAQEAKKLSTLLGQYKIDDGNSNNLFV